MLKIKVNCSSGRIRTCQKYHIELLFLNVKNHKQLLLSAKTPKSIKTLPEVL